MKRKKCRTAWGMGSICLLICSIFMLISCQEKPAGNIPGKDRIVTYESAYGKGMEEVVEKLSISKDDITSEENMPGVWKYQKACQLGENAYTEFLLFDVSDDTFYGVDYSLTESDTKKAADITEKILTEMKEQYGDSNTYPDLSNRLLDEDSIRDIKEGVEGTWKEEWSVSDQTQVTVTVDVQKASGARITLHYQKVLMNEVK